MVAARNVGGMVMMVEPAGDVVGLGSGRVMVVLRVVDEAGLADVLATVAEGGAAVGGEGDNWRWLRADEGGSYLEGFHHAWPPSPLSGCSPDFQTPLHFPQGGP